MTPNAVAPRERNRERCEATDWVAKTFRFLPLQVANVETA
jgi:hypothetical protein